MHDATDQQDRGSHHPGRVNRIGIRRIVAGLAAGTIANAMQMLLFAAEARTATSDLFVSHWLAVVLFHVTAAVLCAGVAQNRLWSSAVFLVPITIITAPAAEAHLGTIGFVVDVAGAVTVGVLWTLFLPRKGAPFVSAAAGAAAGALIAYVHWEFWARGFHAIFTLLAVTLIVGVAMLTSVLAGRRQGALLPDTARSIRRIAVFGSVSIAAFVLQSPEKFETLPRGRSEARPSVVLIVLDTVRADHLELYGYQRSTMPNLERFAKKHAVVVERAIANGPSSLPTHASLFTGLYPVHHGAHKPFFDDPNPPVYAYPLDPKISTLATILSDFGYWTVGLSANAGPLLPVFGLSQGFAVYRVSPSPRKEYIRRTPWGAEKPATLWLERLSSAVSSVLPFTQEYLYGVPYRRAADITDQAIALLDVAGKGSLFLFINYMDAHSPYFPPARYMDRFSGRSASLRSSGFDKKMQAAILGGKRGLTDEERAHFTALYDAELNYLDAQLARLLSRLQQRRDWDEMLVIITSDHGEALGDHDGLEHSNSLYDEITRVPLIVKPGSRTPGAPAPGSVVPGPVESVDVFPLVLEHAGVEVPPGIDGRAWGAGRTHAFGWLYPHSTFSMEELRSVQSDGWKLVQSSTGTIELYNIDRDPREALDLSVAEAEMGRVLLKALEEVATDPRRQASPTPELSEEVIDRLRSLGYVP